MLSINAYPQDYIDGCRSRVDSQLSAWRALADVARAQKGAGSAPLQAALEAFEPEFFNDMVLVLDEMFVHRSRTVEKKDGNPLNEARVLCNSMLGNGGVFLSEKAIKLDPAKSVLGHRDGDEIRVREADFERLAEAYFSEIESKYR